MAEHKHRFKITFCMTCGFRPRAVKLKNELEKTFHEDVELIEATGGLFEVEDRDNVVFSKLKEDRFPEEGEVIDIIRALQAGNTLEESQTMAKANIPNPPTFEEWFTKRLGDK